MLILDRIESFSLALRRREEQELILDRIESLFNFNMWNLGSRVDLG